MRPGAVVVLLSPLLALSLVAACGGSPARSATPASRPAAAALDAGTALSDEGALPSLDALAARGPTDAPLMREAMRVERAAPRSPDVRADKDVCLRASFAASRPVRAWFVDETGAARGDTTTGASGAVPPRGPVCAKKGEALHLVMESAEGAAPDLTARAVVFAAP